MTKMLPVTRLAVELLRAHPDDVAAQRLLYGAAQHVGTAKGARTGLLKQLAAVPTLDPVLADALAADPGAAVRAAVWRRGDWPLERVQAMLAAEPVAAVRLAVLSQPGVPGPVARAACTPWTDTTARAVLAAADGLPADLVHRAVVECRLPGFVHRGDQARWRTALGVPGVPTLVVADAVDPAAADDLDRRVVGYVLRSPEVDDATRVRILTGWDEQVAAGAWAETAFTSGGPFSMDVNLRALVEADHVGADALTVAHRLHQRLGTGTFPGFLAAIAERAHDDLTYARTRFPGALSAELLVSRWRSLPVRRRTIAVAETVISCRLCPTELFTDAVALIEELEGAPVDAARVRPLLGGPRSGMRPWLGRFPELVVEQARHDPGQLLLVAEQMPAVAGAVLDDYRANPGLWKKSPWPVLIAHGWVPAGRFVEVPAADLVAALGVPESARDRLVPLLAELRGPVGDLLAGGQVGGSAAQVVSRVRSLVTLLDGDTPAHDVLAAVAVAHA